MLRENGINPENYIGLPYQGGIRYYREDVFDDLPNWHLDGTPLSELFRTFKINALTVGVDDVSYLVGAAGNGGYFDIIAPPTDRNLKAGDIFMLDTGCIWDGYFSDFDRNL